MLHGKLTRSRQQWANLIAWTQENAANSEAAGMFGDLEKVLKQLEASAVTNISRLADPKLIAVPSAIIELLGRTFPTAAHVATLDGCGSGYLIDDNKQQLSGI